MLIFPEASHLSVSKVFPFPFLFKKKKKKRFKDFRLKVTLILQNRMINSAPFFSVQLMDENDQLSRGLTHNFHASSLKAKHFFPLYNHVRVSVCECA